MSCPHCGYCPACGRSNNGYGYGFQGYGGLGQGYIGLQGMPVNQGAQITLNQGQLEAIQSQAGQIGLGQDGQAGLLLAQQNKQCNH